MTAAETAAETVAEERERVRIARFNLNTCVENTRSIV
jgi:hypothetical protein